MDDDRVKLLTILFKDLPSYFHPTPSHLSLTKNDLNDQRWGDLFEGVSADSLSAILSGSTPNTVLLGYPDDEGILRNGGRPGARMAPMEIRRSFYKQTPHLKSSFKGLDFGDLRTENLNLGERHQRAREVVRLLLAPPCSPPKSIICMGGGHDYGYPDAAAFLQTFQAPSGSLSSPKPLVINFDAHLDVRPVIDNNFHSGTPFRRMIAEFGGPKVGNYDFLEIGIQDQCSSPSHHSFVTGEGGLILSQSEIQKIGLVRLLRFHLGSSQLNRPCFISLDIDAITSSEAPGCSQSWNFGLKCQEISEAITWLLQHFSVKLFSIYEVSPALDQDQQTAKLAAGFMTQFLNLQNSLLDK